MFPYKGAQKRPITSKMRSVALLFLFSQVASSFVIPIKLAAVVNQTEQAEVLLQNGNIWTTTVIIGTPGTAFTVAIDTSSSLLIVPDISSGRKNSFDPSKSSTYVESTHLFSVENNLGMFSGLIGNDTVILGESFSSNQKRTSITVPFATFGQAIMKPDYDVWLPEGVDGVLGLAFPALAPKGSTPVFQTAIQQNDVKIGTYVIWLEDQWESDDNGTAGVIYYGNIDQLHCNAQRNMYHLSSATTFQFITPSFTASGAASYRYIIKTQTYIDSTSEVIRAPKRVVDNILQQLNMPPDLSQYNRTVPCNTKIDFAFNFANGAEHITELNLLQKQPGGSCRLLLDDAPLDSRGNAQFILGYPFLRGRCTYFDVANQQIGFSEPLTHGGH